MSSITLNNSHTANLDSQQDEISAVAANSAASASSIMRVPILASVKMDAAAVNLTLVTQWLTSWRKITTWGASKFPVV